LRPIADAAERALGGIVGQADPALRQEPGQRAPAPEAVVERLGDGALARDARPLRAHPGFEVGDERRAAFAARRPSLIGELAGDVALDREQRIDAPHRLGRDPAPWRRGQLVELAARMRPARRSVISPGWRPGP